MKNSRKLLIGLVLIVVILAAAAVAYNRLKISYSQSSAVEEEVQTDADTDSQDAAASDQTAAEAADPENQASSEAAENDTSDLPAAPDFSCLNTEGEQVKLSDYQGKPVVINFWATWCPPCRSELADFDAMYAKYGEEVQFMMVDLTDGSRETIETVEDFVAENKYSFPVFYDTEGSGVMAYGINAVPQTFFITSDGKVQARQVGAMTGDRLESQLQTLLGE